jgi:flagellar hook-basal body complex protein FliE
LRINPAGVSGIWNPPQLQGGNGVSTGNPAVSKGPDFRNQLTDALRQVNELQLHAEDLARALAAGQAQDLHQVMLAAEKANLSLQFTLQIRNKVIEAYQEIMRIQV